ncbi:MAG: hypothetical protein H6813_06630 [Phycisphaeraceae bacterium]|nr:hypothetical protein [Phycisphaeraceae bacterium]MCB9848146.1 hypothetical protein [Phycisphaeraceae bacterium]
MLEHQDSDRQFRPPKPLNRREIHDAVGHLPPFIGADVASRVLGVSKSTLYKRVARGEYRDAVKRGKPLVFWRDRLIRRHFGG